MKRILCIIAALAAFTTFTSACSSSAISEIIVEYRRTGGILGFNDHLIINSNNKATLTRTGERDEFEINGEKIDRLQELLDAAEFTNLPREYLPPRPGADLIEYIIIYKGHRVRTMDGAVPEVLQPAIELLNQMIDTKGN